MLGSNEATTEVRKRMTALTKNTAVHIPLAVVAAACFGMLGFVWTKIEAQDERINRNVLEIYAVKAALIRVETKIDAISDTLSDIKLALRDKREFLNGGN